MGIYLIFTYFLGYFGVIIRVILNRLFIHHSIFQSVRVSKGNSCIRFRIFHICSVLSWGENVHWICKRKSGLIKCATVKIHIYNVLKYLYCDNIIIVCIAFFFINIIYSRIFRIYMYLKTLLLTTPLHIIYKYILRWQYLKFT